MTIHDDEPDTGPATVRALVAGRWPLHADLPLVPVGTTGTDHAMYRLGTDLLVRMPRTAGAARSLEREVVVLPRLAGALPVVIPAVHHVGHPAHGYPYPWAVLGWIDGTDGWEGRHAVDDPHGDDLASDVADLVNALRATPGADVPRREVGQRGGPLAGVLERTGRWLAGAEGSLPSWVDPDAVRRAADASREAADDGIAYVLTHGDLIPGNVLLDGTRLAAVLDWGYASSADPALDLVPAWALFGPRARRVLRERVDADDATWLRARANALEQALGGIVYYTPRRHPLAQVMGRTLHRVLDDVGQPRADRGRTASGIRHLASGTLTAVTTDTTPARLPDLSAFVAGLPKAELHVHHVGSASPRIVAELAGRHPDSPVPRDPEALAGFFTFTDFAHFVDVYLATVDLLRTAEDVRMLTYEVARELAGQQVRYAELTMTPYTSVVRGIPIEAYTEAIEDARVAAERDHGVVLRWIYDIPGESGLPAADATLAHALDHRTEALVGFGLGGPEIGVPRPQFEPHFTAARAAGLHSVPHSGESTGPQSVWDAITALGAERIGHGTSSVQDPRLLEHLAEHRIPLEVCPTSNVATRVVERLEDHPIRAMRDAGVVVTVNSDDPPMFGTTLNREYEIAAHLLGLDEAGVTDLALAAVEASFAPDDVAARLREEIGRYAAGVTRA